MQKELSYLSPEGFTVFTSQFHKNRGTCCKSICLHCPYGFTIKKLGLHFKDVTDEDKSLILSLMEEGQLKIHDWESYFPQNTKLVTLKDQICGVVFKNHIIVKHLILMPSFQNQGISRELVESYLFI